MFSSQEWWNGASAPGPSPAKSIGQSLRFRGAQQLQRTFTTSNATTCTFSCWVKRSDVGNADNIFGAATSSNTFERLIFNPTPNLSVYSQSGGTDYINVRTSALYRDPSAWYHLVYVKDTTQATSTDRVRLYINGERIEFEDLEATHFPVSNSTSGQINNNVLHTIGRDPDTGVDYLDGYLADVYFIDGQALEPTVFGTLDNNDVWVPAETNFGIGQSSYSDFVFSDDQTSNTPNFNVTTRDFQSSYPASNGFDGSTLTAIAADFANGWAVFRPKEPITVNSKVELLAGLNSGGAIWVNGSDSGQVTDNSTTWVDLGDVGGTLTNLAVKATGSGGAGWRGIRVDGKILTNPFLWSTQTTVTNGGFDASFPVTNLFDGLLTTMAAAANSDGVVTFEPNPAIAFTNGVHMNVNHTSGSPGEFRVTVDGTTGAWTTFSTPANNNSALVNQIATGAGNLERIEVRRTDDQRPAIVAIGLNGTTTADILVDGVNSSYGANGFHLTFEDPNDLGKDYSGNGNDFTPSGFNTSTPELFSQYLFTAPPSEDPPLDTTNKLFGPDNPASLGFNGNTTIGSAAAAHDPSSGSAAYQNWLVWRPPTPATGVTEIQINTSYPCRIWVNGVDTGLTTSSTTAYQSVTGISYPIDVETIAVRGTGSYNAFWAGCVLNGSWSNLIDRIGNDYDLMQDSPTQNYQTYNSGTPVLFGSIDFNDANLNFTSSSTGAVQAMPGTIEIPSTGKWHFEYVYVSPASYPQPGILRLPEEVNDGTWYGGSFNVSAYRSGISNFGIGDGNIGPAQEMEAGDVIAISIDRDVNPNTIRVQKIGSAEDDRTLTANYSGRMIFGQPGAGFSNTATINFGQQPFLLQPDGFEALQTANMPAAPIANGRDHFQAITGPGQGSDIGGAGAGNLVDYLTTSDPNGFNASFPAANGFDGNENTYVEPNTFYQGISFRPPTPIPFTTSLRIKYCGYPSSSYTLNDQPYAGNQASSCIWDDVATGPGELVEFTMNPNGPLSDIGGAGGNYIYAIEIDGVILTDFSILAKAQSTFPNGLWWIKDRANANQHQLVDSVRGGDMVLHTPSTGYEDPYQAPAGDCVAWCWKAGGSAVTNNDGTIETQVSANTESGFSIITYTGDGNAGATLGHGLTQGPNLIICKSRVSGQNFAVGSTYIDDWGTALYLNNNQAKEPTNGIGFWNNTAPDNTVITLGNHPNVNTAGQDTVCYAWHAVPGYSAIGRYTGTGNNDGTFINTGFRPAWVMLRPINNANDWLIMDSTRSPSNPVQTTLKANTTQVENGADLRIDMLSNGFKNITNAGGSNGNQDYIYAAFAENPFSYPVTAR